MLPNKTQLIFANTPPGPEGAHGRVPGLEKEYNAAAARVMTSAGIKVNDLHAFCVPNLGEWQRPKDVHFKPPGSAKLAEKVAGEIASALPGQ